MSPGTSGWPREKSPSIDLDPLVEEAQERVVRTQGLAQPVERGLARQVVDPFHRRGPGLGAHEEHDRGLGEVGEEPLEHDLTEETGDAREEHPLPRQPIHDGSPGHHRARSP